MTATLPARPRATYQRRYAPDPHTYIIVWVWGDAVGRWHWKASHYGCNMYGVMRYQFRGGGEGWTLREVWRQVRRHYRNYAGGRDIVRERAQGRVVV